MENEVNVKRGRKANPIVRREFQIILNVENGDYASRTYQRVTAANYAEAGKMADGLGKLLKLNVMEIEALVP